MLSDSFSRWVAYLWPRLILFRPGEHVEDQCTITQLVRADKLARVVLDCVPSAEGVNCPIDYACARIYTCPDTRNHTLHLDTEYLCPDRKFDLLFVSGLEWVLENLRYH